ncbi:hypothetical protein NDU88_003943 [Pleurodeles waltl]|uniref:C3H1-type domain-containing protein n=1 Tax=Pleurodeles waltl TaxID=8319 RepID=A0AAV7LJZ6_PLEWA|nr:hypothetical protein NDU88_003943 [Pleurodeles waltl]
MWPRAQLSLQSNVGVKSSSQRPNKQVQHRHPPPPPPPTVDPVPLGAPISTSVTGVNPVPQPIEVIEVPGPALGVDSMLADIRRSLAVLAAPTTGLPVHASYSTQGVTPVGGTASEMGRSEQNPPGVSQDATTQALLEVSQMLTKLSAPPAPPPPPTTPWASDSFQSSVQDLKRQVEALATARVVPSLQVSSASPCVSLASGSLTQTPQVEKEHGKSSEQGVSATKPLASAEVSGVDTLLSRPGKLAAHVAPEIKEKIWKGEFVDIFSLVRAKRREVETKEKDTKSSAFGEKKQKIEENITNWLFGYNVFMTVMLEKKPEIGIAMIFYANKILKAHHAYGGNAWLEYDRDFRWAKVEDPAIGWDQTEVNVWLECVNNKLPTKQPFRAQYANDKKGSCWTFNRKICSRPAGTCEFRHSCSFCGHPSHPEFKCLKRSRDKIKVGNKLNV